MAGVYNRKLFRKSSARDELRRMGGIMASSDELLQEAMRTADQAPRPSGPGPMPMPQQAPMMAPPAMAPAMAVPMMGQPMMPQPVGQPMMAPPMQPMMQQPAFMPPQVPQSMQMAPAVPGYFLGGLINVAPAMGSGGESPAAPAAPAPRPNPGRAAGIGPSTVKPVDIGQQAGTVVAPPSVSPDALATAERLADEIDDKDPNEVADEILTTAANEGAETTGDAQFDLAKILESMTGDPAAYEKNIDQLNRGIIGAAIAAGTSARATENIAKGMLVGLEGARATEERRAGDARALQLKALEVRAAEQAARAAESKATTKAQAEAEAKLQDDKRKVYTDTFRSVIEAGVDNVTIPKGMSIEDYAAEVARSQVDAVFGGGAPAAGGAAAPTGGGAKPTLEQFLAAARVQNPGATDAQLTDYYNSTYGE